MQTKATLSVRIDLPGGTRFGPGKASLMQAIEMTGSIAAAARELSMSYPRALRLVDQMNQQFRSPLVAKYQGGANRGGAALTPLGEQVLQYHGNIVKAAEAGNNADLKALSALTKAL